LCTDHFSANVDSYVSGKLTTGDRRILLTKWVGQAWDLCTTDGAMTVRAFEKCGISLPVDGSRDDCINIRDLQGYRVYNDNESVVESVQISNDESYNDEYYVDSD
jgi:hypothetical protein